MAIDSTIVATAVTAASTLVSAAIAHYSGYKNALLSYNNTQQEKEQQRKAEHYSNLVREFMLFRAGADNCDELAALVQQTYLLGSSNVVRATDDFLKYLMGDVAEAGRQNEMYARLFKAMREDLGVNSSNDYPDSLALTLFHNDSLR